MTSAQDRSTDLDENFTNCGIELRFPAGHQYGPFDRLFPHKNQALRPARYSQWASHRRGLFPRRTES
jgi:hypothetical protein